MSLQENLTPEELEKQPPWVKGSIIFSTTAEIIEKLVKDNPADVVEQIMKCYAGAFDALIVLYLSDKEQLLADNVRLLEFVIEQLKEIPEPYVQEDPIPDMGISHADLFGDLTDLPDNVADLDGDWNENNKGKNSG